MMKQRMDCVRWLLILLTYKFVLALADEDFLGCGGFIQVGKGALDLTKVEIRL